MLTNLTIKNFAIIDNLEINFKSGLTVITGETGAGKSIVIDAIDMMLGARADSNFLRSDSTKASIEGVFKLPKELEYWLQANGFENEENNKNLIISRELTPQGSKARINGHLANISHLVYLRDYLVNIHGQNSQTELLNPERQLELLDSFGNDTHEKLIKNYKQCFEEYQLLKAKLNFIQNNAAALQKQLDYLEFQALEIKSANLTDKDEENKLNELRNKILNKKELLENAHAISEIIAGDAPNEGNLLLLITTLKKLILKSMEHDSVFEPFLNEIESMSASAKELSSFAARYSENISSDNENMGEIEERLDLIHKLKRKYGGSIEEIQKCLIRIEDEIKKNKEENPSLDDIEEKFYAREKEVNVLADKLTKSRENLTRNFVDKINEELPTLGFKQPLFVVEFTPCELYKNGKEQIQFLFTSNPDSEPKPVAKGASGGELSRIMLAIKSIVCGVDVINQNPTVIFDEIDIGTSGEIAANVARKLYKISRLNQVFSITHQPIIAAMADEHLVIEKNVIDGQTFVKTTKVTKESKEDALVNLLAPEKRKGISEDAKQFARSLLDNAQKIKANN